MKTKFLISVLISIAVISIVSASMLIPANENAKENAKATENSPVISETEDGNWGLERVDFIHYVKPENPGKPGKTETCYKLMGVKWKVLPVNYVINPSNSGLDESFVVSTIST